VGGAFNSYRPIIELTTERYALSDWLPLFEIKIKI